MSTEAPVARGPHVASITVTTECDGQVLKDTVYVPEDKVHERVAAIEAAAQHAPHNPNAHQKVSWETDTETGTHKIS